MERVLELAYLGLGTTYPNPLVGCVIVHEDKIIGEGWHQKSGEPHAEVNAIASVADKSLLRDSTVYVNLEPCSHFGKTPPCADLLCEHKVKKVIVANPDPNPLVSGKGIKRLLNAGITVETGILAKKGEWLNRRFFTSIRKQRPYIILKWAATLDGFVARNNYDSKWISNPDSRKLVHKWRSEEQGILVGRNTAFYDNPRLNVREWKGNNPTRIVIDRELKLEKSLHLFDQSQKTICFNKIRNELEGKIEYIKFKEETDWVQNILLELNKRNIQSIIVEGGSFILNEFIKKELWDEARIFKSRKSFGSGIKEPQISGECIDQVQIEEDLLTILTKK